MIAADAGLAELAPLVRRAAGLDPLTLIRVRQDGPAATAFVALPFAVLAGRSVSLEQPAAVADATYGAAELIAWLDDPALDEPTRRDAEWRGGLPPGGDWQRLDVIPDAVIRDLVRSGALTLKEAAAREGVPGAQPRAEVADALLDSVVLQVADATSAAEITLRMVSALTRMGFLARDSHASVDVTRRWVRLAGRYGSVYAERRGAGLQLA